MGDVPCLAVEHAGWVRVDYRVVFPEAVDALKNLEVQAQAVVLDRKLLELVGLRVSQLNGCHHCVNLHATNAGALGERTERVLAVNQWQDSALFGARERAALGWGETLTLLPLSGDSSEAYEALAAEFKPKEIVALTAAMIAVNGENRLHIGLGEPSGSVERAPAAPAAPPDHSGTDPRVRSLAARLEELNRELAKVREDYRRAIERTAGPPSYKSGTIHPELDDQAIAPPG
jgi:AhpD family alkylhydroperoxidase